MTCTRLVVLRWLFAPRPPQENQAVQKLESFNFSGKRLYKAHPNMADLAELGPDSKKAPNMLEAVTGTQDVQSSRSKHIIECKF